MTTAVQLPIACPAARVAVCSGGGGAGSSTITGPNSLVTQRRRRPLLWPAFVVTFVASVRPGCTAACEPSSSGLSPPPPPLFPALRLFEFPRCPTSVPSTPSALATWRLPLIAGSVHPTARIVSVPFMSLGGEQTRPLRQSSSVLQSPWQTAQGANGVHTDAPRKPTWGGAVAAVVALNGRPEEGVCQVGFQCCAQRGGRGGGGTARGHST